MDGATIRVSGLGSNGNKKDSPISPDLQNSSLTIWWSLESHRVYILFEDSRNDKVHEFSGFEDGDRNERPGKNIGF